MYSRTHTRGRPLITIYDSCESCKSYKLQSCKNAAATLKIAAVNLTALQIWHHKKSNFYNINLKYKCGCNKFDFLFCQIFIAHNSAAIYLICGKNFSGENFPKIVEWLIIYFYLKLWGRGERKQEKGDGAERKRRQNKNVYVLRIR